MRMERWKRVKPLRKQRTPLPRTRFPRRWPRWRLRLQRLLRPKRYLPLLSNNSRWHKPRRPNRILRLQNLLRLPRQSQPPPRWYPLRWYPLRWYPLRWKEPRIP
jgi:hypothetical protein